MDPITHAALGAAGAQALFGKYSKSIPWQVGALAGMMPDLDIILGSRSDPLRIELWHRHFTHSLAFIPYGALLTALVLMVFHAYRQQWRLVLAAALTGYATHGLLDACTSYGTVLLWPWRMQRIQWDIVSIIDPWITFPLVLGTAWSVIHQERYAVRLGLGFAGLFLAFNTLQHQRAMDAVHAYAKTRHLHPQAIRALPDLASSTHWRVIARQSSCLFTATAITPLGTKSTLRPATPLLLFTAQDLPFPLSQGQQRDVAIFSWFTDHALIVARWTPLILADGRYTTTDKTPVSFWGIGLQPGRAHGQRLTTIPILVDCKPADS